MKKSNRDGFELQLIQVLEKYLGKENLHKVDTMFETMNGKDVCNVLVENLTKPVYLSTKEEEFYYKTGKLNQTLHHKSSTRVHQRKYVNNWDKSE